MMICGQALAQGYIEKLGYYPGFPTHATQWDIVWDQTFLQSNARVLQIQKVHSWKVEKRVKFSFW